MASENPPKQAIDILTKEQGGELKAHGAASLLLSRNKLPIFLSKVPQVNTEPSVIPPQLPQLGHQGGLDLSHLDSTVQFFCVKGLATTTHRSYQSGLNRFCRFCIEHNVDHFPVSESLLCYFVASLGRQRLAPSTIKTYLGGIRHAQIVRGYPAPGESSSLLR